MKDLYTILGVPESATRPAAQRGTVFQHGGIHIGAARAARGNLHSKLFQTSRDRFNRRCQARWLADRLESLI